jgi:hypothetical protein
MGVLGWLSSAAFATIYAVARRPAGEGAAAALGASQCRRRGDDRRLLHGIGQTGRLVGRIIPIGGLIIPIVARGLGRADPSPRSGWRRMMWRRLGRFALQ